MKPIPLVNHLTELEHQQRINKEKSASVKDKYRALLWILQGKQCAEIAKRIGVRTSIIYKCVKRYNTES